MFTEVRSQPSPLETVQRIVHIIHNPLDHPGNKYHKSGTEGCRDQKQDFNESFSHMEKNRSIPRWAAASRRGTFF
jgi:hypothetical protein